MSNPIDQKTNINNNKVLSTINRALAIVVVDDMEISRVMARSALKKAGYQDIRLARDASDALKMLDERPADVVLADWVMPEMDGLELSSHIRNKDAALNHYTSVLLCTAKEGIEPLEQAFQHGVDDYLTKPLNERELAARVHAAGRVTSLQNALLEANLEMARINKKLEEMARTDPLTELGNRRYMQDRLDDLLGETRTRGGALCLAIVDIDFFKSVNDTYGHDVGDEVLIGVSKRLKQAVRPVDVVARMGGEEFVVVMHYKDAAHVKRENFERILHIVSEKPIKTAVLYVPVTVSIGVCCTTQGGPLSSRDDIIKCADQKLYQAKENGRNQVVY